MKTYPVNEIFYSLQGEGYYTGTSAVFVRFAGCNLRCPFCDTDHAASQPMSADDILEAIAPYPAKMVVLTGGEPSLYVDEELVNRLHAADKYLTIETNGTHPLPQGIDWVTLSPKFHAFPAAQSAKARPVLTCCDELKLLYLGRELPDVSFIQARHYFLQPCDTGDAAECSRLLRSAVSYCLEHPEWRLSLQTHKLIGVR